METLWPRLSHVRFTFDALGDMRLRLLSGDACKALGALVSVVAAQQVWTYTPPGDGSLRFTDEQFSRITCLPLVEWLRVRPEIEPFFKIRRDVWTLREDWIRIESGGRAALSGSVQEIITAREGQRCTYCGDTSGPFEYDHIFPVARGGSDDASNLTLACKPCNRSKGARTLAEWMEAKRQTA